MSSKSVATLVLAFDYGERRIGVATGNRLTGTATPLGVVLCRDGEPSWADLDHFVAQWAPDRLVVGRPPHGNDELQKKISNFVHALENRYKLRACLVDESLSSRSAASELTARRRDGSRRKRVQRGDVDKLAACLIAQTWLAEAEPNA